MNKNSKDDLEEDNKLNCKLLDENEIKYKKENLSTKIFKIIIQIKEILEVPRIDFNKT